MRYSYKCLAVVMLLVVLGTMHVKANTMTSVPTSARAAILMDQYGQVLYAYNEDASLPMASTTKIMTALVALELATPELRLTVPKDAVGVEGSSAYLIEGEQLTLLTLLYALMLQSANDAAVAIAIGVSGSVDAFVAEMNRKANALGLSHTRFTNPHGLDDPEHYTSASDLAKLTAYALNNPLFARIVSTLRYQAPVEESDSVRLFVNHNRLLREYDGCVGVKTGYTKRTGRCLVSAATRDGITLIAVTLDDPNDWQDHKRLLDFGFSCCRSVTLSPADGIYAAIPIVGGQNASLYCESRGDVAVTLPPNSKVEMCIELPRFVYAGVSEGQKLGRAVWYLNGTVIAELPLYAVEDATAMEYPLSLWDRIVEFFRQIGRFIIELF